MKALCTLNGRTLARKGNLFFIYLTTFDPDQWESLVVAGKVFISRTLPKALDMLKAP